MRARKKHLVRIATLLGLASCTLMASPLDRAFTYQGRLHDGGSLASGSYDLRFSLHDDAIGGNNMGSPITNSAVLVSNGLFTTRLDFGQGLFDGRALWLQIGSVDSSKIADGTISASDLSPAILSNNVLTLTLDDGNVGIGTSNPTKKLHVVGNIYPTSTITPNSDCNAKADLRKLVEQALAGKLR